MSDDYWTYPRIFVDASLKADTQIALNQNHIHYFKNVLRRQDGEHIRLFNGKDGEWLATLSDLKKKSGNAIVKTYITQQPHQQAPVHLFFAPLKKVRLDMLIEKAVELGATDLHPVITERTQNRHLKIERITQHIIEAAEQCERLTLPELHTPISIKDLPTEKTIYACIERIDIRDMENESTKFIADISNTDMAFLIGPEGGFSEDEMHLLTKRENIKPVSLGPRIYRAETASILCLAHAALISQKKT